MFALRSCAGNLRDRDADGNGDWLPPRRAGSGGEGGSVPSLVSNRRQGDNGRRGLGVAAVVAGIPAAPARPHPPAQSWATWPMPNAVLPGLPHPHDYETDVAVVTDKVTGLMWQRNLSETFATFSDAVKMCDELKAGAITTGGCPRESSWSRFST